MRETAERDMSREENGKIRIEKPETVSVSLEPNINVNAAGGINRELNFTADGDGLGNVKNQGERHRVKREAML